MCAFGFGIYHGGDPDWGYAMIQRAAELNPNSLSVACLAGNTALHWGSIEDAERYLRRGTGLDPSHPTQGNILGGLARISMIKGHFEAALVSARRAHAASPNYGAVRWTLIAANAHLGRREAAKGLLGSFNADHPDVTVQSIRAGQPNGGRMSSTLDGLDYAGLARG